MKRTKVKIFFLIFEQILDSIGNYNPQLFRELKGNLKRRNILIISMTSIVGQILFYLMNLANLPAAVKNYDLTRGFTNRYCLGSPPPNWEGYYSSHNYSPDNYCIKDLLGNWILNDQLWWLDLFVTLSMIGIFALLVVGTYLLIHDLSREENRGTLNFIRLSPQSAKSIFIGKILGVPILLYWLAILALPFHLIAGLESHLPFSLILAFYGILIVSCGFFYSGALLFSLISSELGGFQAFLGSGAVLFFLAFTTIMMFDDFHSPFDWLTLFHPAKIFPYLINATFLPTKTVGYFSLDSLNNGVWYGQPVWNNLWNGIGFILLNYSVWMYWIGQGLQRRFRNSTTTLWTKKQGYWISSIGIVTLLGFVLQSTSSTNLFENFIIFQLLSTICFILLIAALTPGKQTLQDWARYRHQLRQNPRNLIKDLVLGEKSPSILAIALNLGLFFLYVLPAILVVPLENYRLTIFLGLVLEISLILLYAVIFQFFVMVKPFKRAIGAMITIGSLMVLPIICGLFLAMISASRISLTSIFLILLGEWLTTVSLSFQMSKQLQKVGESTTKALLNN